MAKRLYGTHLNDKHRIDAKYGRFSKTGIGWYGVIGKYSFPATLWDGPPSLDESGQGYVRFETREDLVNCQQLQIHPGGQITVRRSGSDGRKRLADVPGYMQPDMVAYDEIIL
jgi:hypothetical protein